MAFSFVCVTSLFLMIVSPLFSQEDTSSKVDDTEVCNTQVCQDSARFLLESMDASVDPCDDFYQHACGGWIDKHPIPNGRRSYGTSDALTDEVHSMVAEMLKNATNENHPKAIIDAALLFQGCIDEGAREKEGLNALRNTLNSLGGWPVIDPQWSNTSYEWYKHVATMRRTLGIKVLLSVDVETAFGLEHALRLNEPEHDIETQHLLNQTSEQAEKVIAAYKSFIISTGKLLNPDVDEMSLENDADEIIQFMSALAARPEHLPQEKRRRTPWYQDLMRFIEFMVTKNRAFEYTPPETLTISDVQRITQNKVFKWVDFLNDVFQDSPKVEEQTEILAYSMAYLKHAVELVQETDLRVVANYIGWTLVKNIGHYTTKDFRDNNDRFRKAMDEEVKSLSQTCMKQMTEVFDFAVGRLYVEKSISEEEMNEVEQLVEDVRSAFEVNFNHNDWMDHASKQKALEKLRNMEDLIGYPSWIKIDSELNDYYSLVHDVRQDKYFESFVRVKTAMEAKSLGKLNQPIDRASEWTPYMSIMDVDAMYDIYRNTMYLPAATLNVPIYKRGTLSALNYAGFGSYIAHEITHGFDSVGHQYDKEGKHADWWTPKTKKKFEEKAECIRKQYSEIVEPMTNTSLRETNTLQDDIADNGAARNAFMAYEMQVLQAEENERNKRNMRLPGLSATPEQLYFLALATMDCQHDTKRSMKWTIENDSHSPPVYRVHLPLRNSRVFAEAFNCPLGSAMNPEKKCQLW